MLRRAVELYEPLADVQAMRLETRLPTQAPLMADDKLIFEAVCALLDNAIKFSPVGSRVEVALERTPQGLEMSVRDYGPGIAAEEREAVLRRFHRGTAAAEINRVGPGPQYRRRHCSLASLRAEAGGRGAWPARGAGLLQQGMNGETPAGVW